MAKAKKENRGGARPGSGPKKKLIEADRKKSYTVSLRPTDRDAIVKKHTSLTKAIESTIPTKPLKKRK